MFAARASSDSPRLKPRTPGPTSPSVAATASAVVVFLYMSSSRFMRSRMRHKCVREHGRFARSEAGYRATELGEDGRSARIEYDPRGKWQGKYNRHDGRQRDPGRLDRKRERRQRAVHRVKRNTLLGGMADRRDALAAALGLRHVVLHVRQRMQLRGLLGKYQRSGEKQVTQSVVRRGRRYRQHRVQVYYKPRRQGPALPGLGSGKFRS